LYLAALKRPDLCACIENLFVVMGASAPHLRAVEQRARELGGRLYVDVADMCPLYDAVDIVLGSGGVSLFERMARGRASVTVTVADNQEYSAWNAAARGGCVFAGRAGSIGADSLSEEIVSLLTDEMLRDRIGRAARELVD